MKLTAKAVIAILGVGLTVSAFTWVFTVTTKYALSQSWLTTLPWMLRHPTAVNGLLMVDAVSLLVGIVPAVMLLWFIAVSEDVDEERILKGSARLVAMTDLEKLTRQSKTSQVRLASVPLPLAAETTHFLLAGATGKGKTTAQSEMIADAHARCDRTVIVDPNGEALSHFWRDGDLVLNPFDRRCPGWNLFNEIRRPYDYARIAASVMLDCADPQGKEFRGYARTLLASVMYALAQRGETNTAQLVHWCCTAPAEELAKLVAWTPAAGQFLLGAERALASTRFVLSKQLEPFVHIPDGPLCLRDWVRTGSGNVYMTWRKDMLPALGPLLGIWSDLLIGSTLIVPADDPPTLWMFLDELGELGNLPSLVSALTLGRKHGLRMVGCVQALSQLVTNYGKPEADTLLSNFLSVLVLGGGVLGQDTADRIAAGLGKQRIERRVKSHTKNKNGSPTTSTSWQPQPDRDLVTSTALTNLRALRGFLKIDGDYPVARVCLRSKKYPRVAEPFEER